MKNWKEGPPTEEGFYVVEWMNSGGFGVFRVADYDGVLIAHHVKSDQDLNCTQLSKWAIRRHLPIPHPNEEILEEHFAQFRSQASEERNSKSNSEAPPKKTESDKDASTQLWLLQRTMHVHSRHHHRIECRCQWCSYDGREPCSEEKPCQTCINRGAEWLQLRM